MGTRDGVCRGGMHDLIVSSSGDSNRKNETNQRFFPEYVFNVDFGLGSLERVGIDQSRLAIRHRHYGGAVSSWLDFHPQAPVRVECKDAEISPCFRMVMVVMSVTYGASAFPAGRLADRMSCCPLLIAGCLF